MRNLCSNENNRSLDYFKAEYYISYLAGNLVAFSYRWTTKWRVHESSLPVAYPGYQVLSDILFRLGLIANCSHTVQYFDCSDLNWRCNHYHLFLALYDPFCVDVPLNCDTTTTTTTAKWIASKIKINAPAFHGRVTKRPMLWLLFVWHVDYRASQFPTDNLDTYVETYENYIS